MEQAIALLQDRTAWPDSAGNAVDDPKRRFAPYASLRDSTSGANAAINVGRRFERADDGRSNGDDAPALRLDARDGGRSLFRDLIRLV
jgi:hypothetical protein